MSREHKDRSKYRGDGTLKPESERVGKVGGNLMDRMPTPNDKARRVKIKARRPDDSPYTKPSLARRKERRRNDA